MKNFIVYNIDGDILRSGTCQDSDFDIQARDGEFIIEGECVDDANYKVIDGEIAHSPKVQSSDEILLKIRKQRDAMLSQTDWTQIPDAPLSDEMKNRYKLYRQALRDLPENYGTINELSDVTFPKIEDF